ncbi:MAG: MarR family transcriptional regulator [Candidatus Gastranaerophilales bacterium]|nr:MarR family transcriptional regulator [Candidatus Gastranaerophilales bacterium]
MGKYEDSLFYQLNSNAKYFNLLFDNFVKGLNLGLNAQEHLALIIISDKKDCCQRDLAKILVKDRANTGKIASTLEGKGLIKIELKTKNNRPVKILSLTQNGKKICKTIDEKVKPLINKINNEISKEKIEQIKNSLKEFRQIVEKVAKTNI